jgi:hypothetical protein
MSADELDRRSLGDDDLDDTRLVCTGERDMASENILEESTALSEDVAEAATKYGITRVPVDYFYYKQYRYTNLSDAIAQAKRDHEPAD